MMSTALLFRRVSQVSSRFARPHRCSSNLPKQPPAQRGSRIPKAQDGPRRYTPAYRDDKMAAAQRLYKVGLHNVYQAPSSLGRTLLSYTIGAVLIGGSFNIYLLRHWDGDTLIGMSGWIKSFVVGANRTAMFFMTFLGGFAIIRYAGFVRSIRLIDIGAGDLRLSVDIRRRMPWSKTHCLVKPGEMIMPADWRSTLVQQNLDARQTPPALATRFFRYIRDFFMMRGVVAPVRFGSEASGMMDVSGLLLSYEELRSITRESFD